MTRQELVQLFNYDLWANRLWLATIPNLSFSAEAIEIMDHVFRAQRIWLERCLNEQEIAVDASKHDALAEDLNAKWIDLVTIGDPEAFVSYERSGEVHFQTLEQIAQHVINHGTYHRGHLRGLCQAANTANFPETDYILFCRESA